MTEYSIVAKNGKLLAKADKPNTLVYARMMREARIRTFPRAYDDGTRRVAYVSFGPLRVDAASGQAEASSPYGSVRLQGNYIYVRRLPSFAQPSSVIVEFSELVHNVHARTDHPTTMPRGSAPSFPTPDGAYEEDLVTPDFEQREETGADGSKVYIPIVLEFTFGPGGVCTNVERLD